MLESLEWWYLTWTAITRSEVKIIRPACITSATNHICFTVTLASISGTLLGVIWTNFTAVATCKGKNSIHELQMTKEITKKQSKSLSNAWQSCKEITINFYNIQLRFSFTVNQTKPWTPKIFLELINVTVLQQKSQSGMRSLSPKLRVRQFVVLWLACTSCSFSVTGYNWINIFWNISSVNGFVSLTVIVYRNIIW